MNIINVIKNHKDKTIKVECTIKERDQMQLRHDLRQRGYKLDMFRSTYYKYYHRKEYIAEYFAKDIKMICDASNKYIINDCVLKGSYRQGV